MRGGGGRWMDGSSPEGVSSFVAFILPLTLCLSSICGYIRFVVVVGWLVGFVFVAWGVLYSLTFISKYILYKSPNKLF